MRSTQIPDTSKQWVRATGLARNDFLEDELGGSDSEEDNRGVGKGQSGEGKERERGRGRGSNQGSW